MKNKSKLTFLIVGILVLQANSCKKWCARNDQCKLEPDSWSYYAVMPIYYYDQKEKKCKKFIWGGCEGTVPFQTFDDCQQKCECQ